LAIPFEGQCADAPEAPGRQLDRLAAGEDGFNDVRCQESELDIAPDVARVDPIAPGDDLDGPDFSSRQLIEPATRLGDQGDQVLIGRRAFALRRADNERCLDTAAPQSNRNGEVNQPFRVGCDVGTIPRDQAVEARSIDLDTHRTGVKGDTVEEAVQQPALAVGGFIIQVIRCRRRTM
jgi:hypothetical protein